MIVELLRSGNRVGVTSNSHRAICLLLNEAARVAQTEGNVLNAVKIGGEDKDHTELLEGIQWVKSASDVLKRGTLPLLIGGTAWVFQSAGGGGQAGLPLRRRGGPSLRRESPRDVSEYSKHNSNRRPNAAEPAD